MTPDGSDRRARSVARNRGRAGYRWTARRRCWPRWEGFESLSLARDGVERFRLERLVPFLDRLVDLGVTRAVFAGGVHRPRLDPALLDPATMQLLPRIMAAMGQGDDGALREVIALMDEWGITVVGVQDICPSYCPIPASLAPMPPTRRTARTWRAGLPYWMPWVP